MLRKNWIVVLAIVLVVVVAAAAYAQMMGGMGGDKQGGMMGGRHMMGMRGMCPMHCGGMQGMQGRAAMVVDNNAVYVLAGNQLLKYDKNLQLMAEAEIKMDWEKMGKMGKHMQKQCPMMKEMMEEKEEAMK